MTLSYTNRRGQTYYLHASTTKTGRSRIFVAKTVGEGALAAMPPGFELTESVNGVVSVRRIDPNAKVVPTRDLDLARAELARHRHLRQHRVDAVGDTLIVFEPSGGHTAQRMPDLARLFGMSVETVERRLSSLQQRVRYAPVMNARRRGRVRGVPDDLPRRRRLEPLGSGARADRDAAREVHACGRHRAVLRLGYALSESEIAR